MEVRDTANKRPGAIADAVESVRRRVTEECGLCPTRVVSDFFCGCAVSPRVRPEPLVLGPCLQSTLPSAKGAG